MIGTHARTRLARVFAGASFALALAASGVAAAAEFNLTAVTFPEGKTIDLVMARTNATPNAAKLEASVKYSGGQAKVEVSFKKMEPAILFGGDLSSYVVWAVTRDGAVENLGELDGRREQRLGEGQVPDRQEAVRPHGDGRAVLPRGPAERVRDRDLDGGRPAEGPERRVRVQQFPHRDREGGQELDRGADVQGQEAGLPRAGRARDGPRREDRRRRRQRAGGRGREAVPREGSGREAARRTSRTSRAAPSRSCPRRCATSAARWRPTRRPRRRPLSPRAR